MKKQLKYLVISILLLTALLYGIPFTWGGYPLSFGIGLILIIVVIIAMRQIRQNFPLKTRNSATVFLFNTIITLHLALIFVNLVINPNLTWLFGLVLGLFSYFIISQQMKNYS